MKTIIIFFLILFFNGCMIYIIKDCPCPKIEGYVWNYGQYMGDNYPKWRYEPIDTFIIEYPNYPIYYLKDYDSLINKISDGTYH